MSARKRGGRTSNDPTSRTPVYRTWAALAAQFGDWLLVEARFPTWAAVLDSSDGLSGLSSDPGGRTGVTPSANDFDPPDGR